MQTRRDFLRNAAVLTGGAYAWGSLPDAIARALAIRPNAGTTFRDAEHVVILMQENRSFDHAYGALQGVRGYRDPRAHILPNGNLVWFQTDARGDTYAPFRLDMAGSSSTWMGGLPHSWPDQVDARNGGKYDKWLIAKQKRTLPPFALGHYARRDIPFYYALADAFTVCDQAFCSSLTGTTANRHFLWSGTIRRDTTDFPRVQNSDTDYNKEASWRTFPDRLEEARVSWRIYQNEISLDTGLSGAEDAWLSNFTDNNIEWFSQFNVRFARSRRAYLPVFLAAAPQKIAEHERALRDQNLAADARTKLERELASLRTKVREAEVERAAYTDAAWNALTEQARSLHERAFTTNVGDPGYRSLTNHVYQDGNTRREVPVPSGDVLHQFRQDVSSGALPAVSWLVAPQNFSDHPGSPWYGAWYVSEVLDILTKNPEVWKKTVFILCYDENDGYFDHVPPFVAPHPARPETGKASAGIDTAVEWANAHGRDSAVGLGYRVPLVVASPWSRGGCVNSEVFDHTSVLRFLEVWLAARGTPVKETNISEWRRTVCGDLTSIFRPYEGEQLDAPAPLTRNAEVERIHSARFREAPKGGVALSKEAIAAANVGALQESGTRPSCPLPYELVVNAELQGGALALLMAARKNVFGEMSAGAPFNVYSYLPEMTCRSYAVKAGDVVRDTLPIGNSYRVRVDGPNGFMREFTGENGARLGVVVDYADESAKSGLVEIQLSLDAASGLAARDVTIRDESYGGALRQLTVRRGEQISAIVDTASTRGWYDFTVRSEGTVQRYAGRVETGAWSITDPAMGGA